MDSSASVLESVSSRRIPGRLADVDTWIFDLDDTLYPRSVGLHEQMKARVVRFIADLMNLNAAEAEAVHSDYYERYGATLQGLMELHGVAPAPFLDFVHTIDLSPLSHDDLLIKALEALPGRRIVFTNSSRRHAASVLEAMNMADLFEATYSIEDCGFIGKPQRSAYASILAAHAIDPRTSAMFDDRIGNLVVPHDLGIRTVLISPPNGAETFQAPRYVDAVTDNLARFLSRTLNATNVV
ncbi:MAG: pyrimidine 5'-nucleotidase [Afipia sp.]